MQTNIIATGLHQRGHEVIYGAVGGRKSGYDAPYSVRPIGKEFLSDFDLFIRESRPDVIYWRNNKPHLLASVLVAKRAGVPMVFGISHVSDVTPWKRPKRRRQAGSASNQMIEQLRNAKRALNSRLNHVGFRFVDGVTSLNRDYLGRVPVTHRLHLPNAVPEGAVPFSWPRPFILWVANVKASKHPEAYVEVARRCQDLGVDFLMVGRLADPAYRSMLGPAGGPPNFHFLGPKTPEEVNGMLRESLFLVHTCFPEGFGNNFIQAWRAGRPTLSLHFDPEGLIEERKVGFHSLDIDSLVHHVGVMTKDHEMRTEMARRALELGSEFSIDRTVGRIEHFLVEIVLSKQNGSAGS